MTRVPKVINGDSVGGSCWAGSTCWLYSSLIQTALCEGRSATLIEDTSMLWRSIAWIAHFCAISIDGNTDCLGA